MSAKPGANKPPRRWSGFLLPFASGLTYAYLYFPIIVVILYSFSATKVNVFPIESYTLDWYRELRQDDEIWSAVALSVRVGLVSSLIALILGTMASLAIDRYVFRGKSGVRFLILLPITLPGIVTGIALLAAWSLLDKPIAQWTFTIGDMTFPWPLIIAHTTFCITLVMNTVVARLGQLPRYLGEASADLGSKPLTTFRKITLPLILPAMVSGAILAFTLSFDEVVVSLFVKGRENTLPLLIWGRLRLGLSPEINAIASIITVVSLIGILFSTLLMTRTRVDSANRG